MRILIDMNLTPLWASYLASAGVDAVHWSALGPADADDEMILARCHADGYVLLTNDLDFPRLIALASSAGPSVLVFRGEMLTPAVRVGELLHALATCGSQIEEGVIVMLESGGGIRLRRLPVR